MHARLLSALACMACCMCSTMVAGACLDEICPCVQDSILGRRARETRSESLPSRAWRDSRLLPRCMHCSTGLQGAGACTCTFSCPAPPRRVEACRTIERVMIAMACFACRFINASAHFGQYLHGRVSPTGQKGTVKASHSSGMCVRLQARSVHAGSYTLGACFDHVHVALHAFSYSQF